MKNTIKTWRLLSTSLFLSSALVPVAVAQDNSSATSQEPTDVITVTAQFREQSVLEVPIAVTAYDGEFLENIGVDEFDELSAFVPGFVVQEQSPNNPGFVLRGITSDDGSSNIEPRVSVFQNGVSISRSRGSVIPFFDLERVEVLNGPQGTLFGRSAQIGAVHVITNKADYEFDGQISAEVGNFDRKKFNGFVNIPLVEDVLAVRFAGYHESRDGFVDNTSGRDLNSVDTFAARGSLVYEPTDTLRVDIIGQYVENTPTGISFKSGVIPAIGGDTNPFTFASLNSFGDFFDRGLSVDRNLFDITGIINWSLSDNWNVTSTTSYREFESLEIFDPDGTGLDLLIFAEDAEGEQFSSDIRFSYDNGDRFSAFFGGGIFLEEGNQSVPLGFDLGSLSLFTTFGAVPDPLTPGADVPLPASVNPVVLGAILTGDPTIYTPTGLTQLENATNFADNFSYDLFTEVSYEIVDNLTLTAGARFTADDKESLFSASVDVPNPFLLGAVEGGTNVGRAAFSLPPVTVISVLGGDSGGVISSDDQAGLDNTFNGFAWRAVLNYEFGPDQFVYFNYSRGRRPEVIEEDFSRDGSDADGDLIVGDVIGEFVIVPDETVDSFEIGLKGKFFEDRITFQTAAYYYDYTNFQTSVAVNAPGSAPEFDLINAGNADSYGVETSIIAALNDYSELFVTYGYNKSRFSETDSQGNPQQFADNQFRLSPDHALSVGMSAVYPVSDSATAFIRPTFTWQSEVFFTNDNDIAFNVVDAGTGATIFTVPSISQEAYGLFNLNAGVEIHDGSIVLEAYAKNLFDKEYLIDAGNTGGVFQIPTFIRGTPRFFGGGVTVRF